MMSHPECGAEYSVRRYYVDRFFARVFDGVASGSRVLDLGGLRTQKRGQFNLDFFDVWAICVNMTRERRPHVQADAHDLPFADGAFDVVVCGEVLEHVKSPIGVLAEARRVLRPGGRLVATVPFLYRIHADPHDYGRYTQHYWYQTLAELGWSGVQIEHHGAFFSVLADFAKQYVSEHGVRRPFGHLAAAAVHWIQRRAVRHDASWRTANDPFFRSFTTGYGIEAVRPE